MPDLHDRLELGLAALRSGLRSNRYVGPLVTAARRVWYSLGGPRLLDRSLRSARRVERLMTTRTELVDRVRANRGELRSWVRLIDRERRIGALTPGALALVEANQIDPDDALFKSLAPMIAEKGEGALAELADDPIGNLPRVIEEIVRWQTVVYCRELHGPDRVGRYFSEAEAAMQRQWDEVIWPIIKDQDFCSVLDLGCGHGRNTEHLRRHAGEIHLVDVNQSCIEVCRSRFGDAKDGCSFHYHLTDGNHLRMIADSSITFGYSWDSMVHFDKLVVRDYLLEFARVLKPGARAFLHHSNYGAANPNSSWVSNHGNRSDLSAGIFRQYVEETGMTIFFQRLSGKKDGWGMDELDCLSVVEKPSARGRATARERDGDRI